MEQAIGIPKGEIDLNIDDYRAIVAQQATQQDKPAEQTPSQTQPTVEQPKPVDEKPAVPEVPATPTDKVVIEGQEVSIDELKNGYLRQSDYTKKTQEVSRQRKEAEDAIRLFEQLKSNPQMAEQLKQVAPLPNSVDPATSKVVELENKLYDFMLEQEISRLQDKYSDFEVREVLEVAKSKQLNNLEDAYKLLKSNVTQQPVDLESLKKQLREQVLKELQTEKGATQTLITSNSGVQPVQTQMPSISASEQRVARGMKLSDEDYIKWRDASKKR